MSKNFPHHVGWWNSLVLTTRREEEKLGLKAPALMYRNGDDLEINREGSKYRCSGSESAVSGEICEVDGEKK